jgi:hypothetical protein
MNGHVRCPDQEVLGFEAFSRRASDSSFHAAAGVVRRSPRPWLNQRHFDILLGIGTEKRNERCLSHRPLFVIYIPNMGKVTRKQVADRVKAKKRNKAAEPQVR